MADKDYRQELTDKLIAQLEAGTAPWQRPWGDAPPQRAYNPTTGKEYRGANSIALDMQGYGDPRWCTYKQASEQGWQVRKGEKGSLVEYWKFHEDRKEMDAQGKERTVRAELERPRVFRAVVFNASQMDGVPALEVKEREWNPIEKAEKILTASGADIRHDQSGRAFYRPASDTIHLPAQEQFPSEAAYYSTALHELGHWTGHESRLDRKLDGGFGSESYAREELRAELASYFVAARLGVPHDPGQHAAYVGSWIKALKEDKNEIFRASRDAEQITELVLSYDKELTAEKKAQPEAEAKPDLRADMRALGQRAGSESMQHKREDELTL